jgi:hypothetical protein
MSTTILVCLSVAGVLAVASLAVYATSFRLVAPVLILAGLAGWVLPYGLWAIVALAASLALGLPFLTYLAFRLHRARRFAAAWAALVDAFHSQGRGSR